MRDYAANLRHPSFVSSQYGKRAPCRFRSSVLLRLIAARLANPLKRLFSLLPRRIVRGAWRETAQMGRCCRRAATDTLPVSEVACSGPPRVAPLALAGRHQRLDAVGVGNGCIAAAPRLLACDPAFAGPIGNLTPLRQVARFPSSTAPNLRLRLTRAGSRRETIEKPEMMTGTAERAGRFSAYGQRAQECRQRANGPYVDSLLFLTVILRI